MHTYTHTVNKENFDQASSLSLLFFPSNPLRWKQGNISTDGFGCLIFSSTRAIRSLLELKKKTRERGREVTAQASASKRTDEIQTRDNFLTLLLADRPANRLLSLSLLSTPPFSRLTPRWLAISRLEFLSRLAGVCGNPFVFKLSARLIKASFFTSNLQ